MGLVNFLYGPEMALPRINTEMKEDPVVVASQWDTARIQRHWQKQSANPKIYSTPNSLATLFDSSATNCVFRPTDYKTVSAVYRDRNLTEMLRKQMRIASVSGTVILKDGYIPVQRRAEDLLIAPGMLDSSFAGLVQISNGWLNHKKVAYGKLENELGIPDKTVKKMELRGMHSSERELTAMFDYRIRVSMKRSDLSINKDLVSEVIFVRENDLPDFVFRHYMKKRDMIGDGVGTLSSSLSKDEFFALVKRMEGVIEKGYIDENEFVRLDFYSTVI